MLEKPSTFRRGPKSLMSPFLHSIRGKSDSKVAQEHDIAFFLLIVLLPFHNSPALAFNLFDIQGLKPLNILSIIVLVFLLIEKAKVSERDRLYKRAFLYFKLYAFAFSYVFLRSVSNQSLFHVILPTAYPESQLSYILSYWLVPLSYLVPFIFILRRIATPAKMRQLVSAIGFSLFLFSCVFLYAVATNPGALLTADRSGILELCNNYFGLHYNSVGTIYLIGGPLLLYKAIEGRPFWILNFLLGTLVILLDQSRSAFIAFLISNIMFIFLVRKGAGGRAWIIVVGMMTIGALVPTLSIMLSVGTQQSSNSVDTLLQGRASAIWVPLITQWWDSPSLFLLGAGKFGILTTSLWREGAIYQAVHAHNAFIDFFLDSGFVLLVIAVIALTRYIYWSWTVGKSINSPVFWAAFCCVAAYMIGMFTEREIYPSGDNMTMFPIIGLMLNVARSRGVGWIQRPKTFQARTFGQQPYPRPLADKTRIS